MANFAEADDLLDIRVFNFVDGTGVVVDNTKRCGLRIDAEAYFAEFNSRCAVADWLDPKVRDDLEKEGKQLSKDFCKDYGIKYKELM